MRRSCVSTSALFGVQIFGAQTALIEIAADDAVTVRDLLLGLMAEVWRRSAPPCCDPQSASGQARCQQILADVVLIAFKLFSLSGLI